MSLLALIGEGTNPIEVAQPALSTLDKSVIGALLVVSWLISSVLIWQLIKSQNARTQDQKEMRESSDKLVGLVVTTSSDMKSSLDKLTVADDNSRQVILAMNGKLDMLIMWSGRRPSPYGTPAVPRPQEPKGG